MGDAPQWCWPQYVASWAKADLAITTADFRRTFGVGVSGNNLHVTCFDGSRPNSTFDTHSSDISDLPEPAEKKKKADRGGALNFAASVAPRPIALALAASGSDGPEYLLVLLSSGQLLAASTVHLSIESVLGIFSEVSDDHGAGSALAAIRHLGWAVVATGTKLGMAEVEIGSPDLSASGAPAASKTFDLPRGCSASMLKTFNDPDPLLLVGCSNSQLLLYACSLSQKQQALRLSFSLVQTLDITGAVVQNAAGGIRAAMSGWLFGGGGSRSRSRSKTPRNGGDPSISDAFELPGLASGEGFLVACGGAAAGPGSTLGLWQTSADALQEARSPATGRSGRSSRSPAPTSAGFLHVASGSSPTKILRVLMIAGSRAGGGSPVLLTLDAFGDITVWAARPGRMSPMSIVPGRCSFEIASGRTFSFTGSLFLLVGTGSRSTAEVGWLDISALLESAGSCGLELAVPLAGRSRSRSLMPPLPARGNSGKSVEISNGGEIFFVSASGLRCYKIATGKTTPLQIAPASAAAAAADWRPVGIVDEFVSSSGATSHLLVAVMEAAGASAICSVWLLSLEGELVARMPGAVDAAFSGTGANANVVWLAVSRENGKYSVNLAAAFASPPGSVLQPSRSVDAEGVERIIISPPGAAVAAAQFPLYWGSRLSGGPLRFAQQTGGAPAGPVVALPSCGPMELVDSRWDGNALSSSRCTLALAVPYAVMAIQFSMQAGRIGAEILAWLDLRATLAGAGRTLSLSWLRATGNGDSAAASGLLLFSTPSGVLAWAVRGASRPKTLVLYERPQLLVAVCLDRLLTVEMQGSLSFFASADRPGRSDESGSSPTASALLPLRPRARIRTRPLSCFEVLSSFCSTPEEPWAQEADWRLAPAVLSKVLPDDFLAKHFWPAAACTEAPPQLRESAGAFLRAAVAAHDEFRALAALTSGLGTRRGRADDASADEARAAANVSDCIHHLRSSQAYMDMLGCAASLLVNCAKGGGTSESGLVVVGNGLVKHELLPLGNLLSGSVRSCLAGHPKQPLLPLLLGPPCGMPHAFEASAPIFHWSQALCSAAPLADVLLSEALKAHSRSRQRASASDFSASALLRQQYVDTPGLRRAPQVIQPGGTQACQLHTATLMQWLGLGSTKVQVRVFKAIQQEEESPSTLADSPSQARSEPAVLSSGLLVYWRCADGDGSNVRDSGGCGRSGTLSGANWKGPLRPDEPMESSDEWGQALSPNFAISFQQDGQLRYVPGGKADQQMLSLVAGNRSDGAGQQLLEKARAADADTDGDLESAEVIPGWTVELWVRLTADSNQEVLLFSRGSDGRPPALTWHYRPRPAGFRVAVAGQSSPLVAGNCQALAIDEWVHLALRSDLTSLQVWVDDQVVMQSLPSSTLTPVSHDTSVSFGPSEVLEITEVRVWGVYRSDTELAHYQRQCLPTLLNGEHRAEAWKKVKIRANTAEAAPAQDGGFGLWSGFPAAPGFPAQSGPAPSRRSGWSEQATSSTPADASAGFGDWPSGWGDSSAPPAPEPWAPAAGNQSWLEPPVDSEKKFTALQPPPQPAAEETSSAQESSEEDVAAPPQRPAPVMQVPANPMTNLQPPAPPPAGRLMKGILARRKAEEEDAARKAAAAAEAAREAAQKAQSAILPSQLPVLSRQSKPGTAATAPQAPPPRRRPPAPAREKAPALQEAFPRAQPSELPGISAADAALHAGVSAMEKQNYSFAAAAFKATLPKLTRLLPTGTVVNSSTALRARVEAAVSYSVLCSLLHEIKELQSVASAGPALQARRDMCERWSCLLRVAKAPQHTIQLSLQAMASFFHFAKPVGGWTVARQIAKVMLERFDNYLAEDERTQAEYILEAAQYGHVARGASMAAFACGACPSCKAPLDALAPRCNTCGAQLAVDFETRKLCDARVSDICTLCAAVFSRHSFIQDPDDTGRRRLAGISQPVRSSMCRACNVGELKSYRLRGQELAF